MAIWFRKSPFFDKQTRKIETVINFKILKTFLLILLLCLFVPYQSVDVKQAQIAASFLALLLIKTNCMNIIPAKVFLILKWLGDRSYSIYLVNLPLIYLAKYSEIAVTISGGNLYVQVIFSLISTIILGSLSYSYIENRYRFRNNFTGRLSRFVGVYCIALSFFIFMYFGSVNKYWGLDRSIQKPIYAGHMDPKCERESKAGPPCVYNKQYNKTVLLIGDSHAGHLSQAVIDAAKIQNYKTVIYIKGCKIAFRSTPDITKSCVKQNKAIISLVSYYSPELVIVSYFINSEDNLNELQSGLRELKEKSPNILLIENNPIFPDNFNFNFDKSILTSRFKPKVSFAFSEMNFADQNASNQLASFARASGIRTLNMNSLFCKDYFCSVFEDGEWLYHDNDHLSLEGAKKVIPLIEKFLD